MAGTLILFTRLPEAGHTKTRLIPALGAEGAARFQRQLVTHTLATARTACKALDVRLEIHHTGPQAAMSAWLGPDQIYRSQAGGDLGQRMEAALAVAELPAVLIGTDCPDLTPTILSAAFAALSEHDVVLGPAADGGYYLVGWRQPRPDLFTDIPWGTAEVLDGTRARLRAAELGWLEVATLHDIDRPEDLARVPHHLLPVNAATGPKDK